MSEHLDLVRSICVDWERGDLSRDEWADRKIEFGMVGGPDPGSWTGVVGMAEHWRDCGRPSDRRLASRRDAATASRFVGR
jgi:hypothetical protein